MSIQGAVAWRRCEAACVCVCVCVCVRGEEERKKAEGAFDEFENLVFGTGFEFIVERGDEPGKF